jgi:uncharacterized membrane protein YhaH (DUF805 family)
MFSGLLGFNGRIGRGGWWFGQLIGLVTIGALFSSAVSLHDPHRTEVSNNDFLFVVIFVLCLVAVLIINVCSTVKRYHDRGKSGWWYFMALVPFIGGIWQLIECGFCSGDEGDNDYGPPPGSAKRMADLKREVSVMSGGGLSKVDDDYIEQYAKKHALSQAQQQTATTSNVGQLGSARPVFGKR